jgi:hypothetical protein
MAFSNMALFRIRTFFLQPSIRIWGTAICWAVELVPAVESVLRVAYQRHRYTRAMSTDIGALILVTIAA